jgi:hypothetical protein
MRMLRLVLRTVIPLAGMFVAFAGVLYLPGDTPRLIAVLAGILLIEAGVWNLANVLLPSTRRYIELRAEVRRFLKRIPALNAAAVRAGESNDRRDRDAMEAIVAELHASVDRMAAAAGKPSF